MVNGSPLVGYMVAPTGATTTFCPAATLGAPQTMESSWSLPILTFVSVSLSALGCLDVLITSPMTKP